MKNLVISICALCATSCTQVLWKLNGVRDPDKPVSQEEVIRFAVESGIDTTRVLFWISPEAKTGFIRRHDYIPDIQVYDRHGHWLPYRDKSACNAAGFSLARELCGFAFGSPDTTEQLARYLSGLRTSDGRQVSAADSLGRDYTVLITWARYLGRITKKHLVPWQRELRQLKGCNLEYYFVSFDRLRKK